MRAIFAVAELFVTSDVTGKPIDKTEQKFPI